MGFEINQYRIFCGGAFCFDCRDQDFKVKASGDYRATLLEDVELLLNPDGGAGVIISERVSYIGPFYFETETMKAEDIIRCEKKMIEECTDAIFYLDTAACPGTITEVMYANSLRKRLHIFYLRQEDNVETESNLHSPCWYPMLFCAMTNNGARLYPCRDIQDAIIGIKQLVASL